MLECFAVNERIVNKETGEVKAFWTRIGVAFKNKDDSLTLRLDALPTNGTVIVRKAKDEKKSGGGHGH